MAFYSTFSSGPALAGVVLAVWMGGVPSASAAFPVPDWKSREHPAAKVPAGDPASYPDADGFEARRKVLIEALATNELGKWRRGFFAGGDPGKYLPGAAMAKLLLNPADAEAAQFMNDARSPKEHYHFAAINWARFLPLFGGVLTPETRKTLAAEAAKYSAYLNPSGTENHRTMNLCAAAVLPEYLDGGRLAHKDKEAALKEAKAKLRTYVQGLYAAGQGEWDSPTYLMFDLHGFLNIYDFSSDPELRLIAAAALDWFTAGYALKYRDGIYTGPNQRGYYDRALASIADQTGWLWWGSSVEPQSTANFLYAIHPATSSWRPNAVLTRIARKELPGLPVTQENTKPNYWFGQGIPAKAGEYPETLHLSKSFTLGSIWRGFGSQITRFHLVANGPDGPLALTGGHPRKSDHTGKKLEEITYRDGGGRYDQSAQVGPVYVSISRIPEDEAVDYSFVSLPAGVEPEKIGDRWVFRMGGAWVAVVPFTAQSEVAEADPAAKQKEPLPRILRITGRPAGFAVMAAEAADHADAAAFAQWSARSCAVDLAQFATHAEVTVRMEGRGPFTVRHDAEGRTAQVQGLPIPSGAVYSGPFVKLDKGVLEVSDGSSGYKVDFSGSLPVYRP